MQKTKPKMLKKQKTTWVFYILIDHTHSKKKNVVFWFFHFKTKKTRDNQKKHLLSQNQTFSQKFVVFLVLLEFV